MNWVIEPYSDRHDRVAFRCGKPSLDDFFARYVGQYERRDIGRARVLVRDDGPRAFGYYTLSASSVALADLPKELAKRLPRHPVPVVLLGRLAVDESVRGQGLGATLLRDALARCVTVAAHVGVFAVVVDALDDVRPSFTSGSASSAFPPSRTVC